MLTGLRNTILKWRKENHNITITIKDLEINPYIITPNDTLILYENGILIQDNIFYTWTQVRSIQKGGVCV